MTDTLQQLSADAMFGMLAFNTDTYIWKPNVVRALPSAKAAALQWMGTVPVTAGCYVTEAALATLNISNASSREYKRVIFLGNVGPFDANTALSTITGANYANTPIDCFLLPDPHGPPQPEFWQSLAAANGGDYEQVQ